MTQAVDLSLPKSKGTDHLDEQYWTLTTELREILKSHDLPIKSDPKKAFPYFQNLPENEKVKCLASLSNYIYLSKEAVKNNFNLISDKRFMWGAFKQLKVSPSAGLLDEIEDGDYVEVYDPTGVQVFANFEFCRLITYTIEELTCRKWAELYQREPRHTKQIMDEFIKTITVADGPFIPAVDVHLAREKDNPTNAAEVTMKKFAPLFDHNGKRSFMIGISRLRSVTVPA